MLDEFRSSGTLSHQRSSHPTLLGTRFAASPFLSTEDRLALERVALPARSVAAGKDLLRESERAAHIEVLIDGWACRYKMTRDCHRQIVALLTPGEAANLDALLFTRLHYAVRTLTPTKVLTLPRDRVLALAEQHSGIAKTLGWLALNENAILSQWALCLGRLSARQRLAHLLCEMSARLGDLDDGESRFELPLTQEQIADVLGLTSVHVNRTVQQLRAESLIETKGRTVMIADMDALRQIAGVDPAYLQDGRASVHLAP